MQLNPKLGSIKKEKKHLVELKNYLSMPRNKIKVKS